MNIAIRMIAVMLVGVPAMAATAAETAAVDRDIKQEQRIEQGLQSGALNTREAARLEQQQAHVEQMEARAARDGNVSSQEAARIQEAQNRTSLAIRKDKHNAQLGNPNSASSQRMQADAQRDINQQTRIRNGLADGSLTVRESSRLEHQQAHGDRQLARAGADGHVGKQEQQRVAYNEARQSNHIWRQRHDAQTK